LHLSSSIAFFLIITVARAQQCPVGHRCHPEATCSVSQTVSIGYTCVCGNGYLGNGFECFTVTAVASGGFHTCVIISDGSVKVGAHIFTYLNQALIHICRETVLGQQQQWADR
jgi:hypothetical protein